MEPIDKQSIMALVVTTVRDVLVIEFPRRFDAGTAPGIESELKVVLAGSPKKVILGFSPTDYIASAGLRVLLQFTRDLMKSGGKVVFTGIRPDVHRIFEMAGFTSIFTILPTREDGLEAFG